MPRLFSLHSSLGLKLLKAVNNHQPSHARVIASNPLLNFGEPETKTALERVIERRKPEWENIFATAIEGKRGVENYIPGYFDTATSHGNTSAAFTIASHPDFNPLEPATLQALKIIARCGSAWTGVIERAIGNKRNLGKILGCLLSDSMDFTIATSTALVIVRHEDLDLNDKATADALVNIVGKGAISNEIVHAAIQGKTEISGLLGRMLLKAVNDINAATALTIVSHPDLNLGDETTIQALEKAAAGGAAFSRVVSHAIEGKTGITKSLGQLLNASIKGIGQNPADAIIAHPDFDPTEEKTAAALEHIVGAGYTRTAIIYKALEGRRGVSQLIARLMLKAVERRDSSVAWNLYHHPDCNPSNINTRRALNGMEKYGWIKANPMSPRLKPEFSGKLPKEGKQIPFSQSRPELVPYSE